jgi:hypothetical protein
VERRESKYKCPKCEVQLVERWDMAPSDSYGGGTDLKRIGRPICPEGHTITEWGYVGQPLHAV